MVNIITVADSIEMAHEVSSSRCLWIVRSKFDLDIIKFDDWLHEQGYTEKEHGSMRDFIQIKYGEEVQYK